MAIYRITVSTSKVGSKVEKIVDIDDYDNDYMDDRELEEIMRDEMHKMISWDFERIDE